MTAPPKPASRACGKTTTAASNGQPNGDTLAGAIAYEQAIADEAAGIRGGKPLDAALLDKLMPLLRKPIPQGFIVTTEATKGKPYDSTGVKSMQVQINRMDGVLGATNWGWHTDWFEDGKVAEVAVWIGQGTAQVPLVRRVARGGVNQASTEGNRYKGSETNAGKLAFARVGPGWEIYVGATDLDPDVSEDAAKAQEKGASQPDASERKLPAAKVESLEKIIAEAGLTDTLPMKLRGFGVDKIADLTVEQGISLFEWASVGGES